MKCAHPGCNCAEASVQRNGKGYCSEHCANGQGGSGRGPCGCGHPGCGK